jgi:alginate O-acetyltransferase complex protein AlgI
MSFNSPEFFVFLSLVVVAYHVSPASLKRPILLVASYGFYMSWNPWYGVLLFAVTLISYLVGRAMDEGRGRAGVVLWTGIAGHLAILVVFKYAAFLLDNAEGLSRAFGASWRAPFLEIVPPLGLSFYVFQSISYMADVYRKQIGAERSLWTHALYIAFFPQLVAGPIERAARLLPQLRKDHPFDREQTRKGALLIAGGLFKKVVIADTLAVLVSGTLGTPERHGGFILFLGAAMAIYMLYCDIGGYTDIAVGCGKMLGVRLSRNFNRPFSATNIAAFWQRWHMTVSGWFRDYVFFTVRCARLGVRHLFPAGALARRVMEFRSLGLRKRGARRNLPGGPRARNRISGRAGRRKRGVHFFILLGFAGGFGGHARHFPGLARIRPNLRP